MPFVAFRFVFFTKKKILTGILARVRVIHILCTHRYFSESQGDSDTFAVASSLEVRYSYLRHRAKLQ